jgi:hypothetical protein
MVRPALTFGSDSISFEGNVEGNAGCDKIVNSDGSIGYCHAQYSHGDFNGVEVSTDAGQVCQNAHETHQHDYCFCA